MSAIHQLTTSHTKSESRPSLFHRLSAFAARLNEPFWLCLSFLLFLVTGPFSVIAVLYGLWSLSRGEYREKMVEPASC
ncbi:MAG: hypothetical protein RBR09_08555 [Desulfobulbaceae bacterium]|nr:hypothetical protein [Desulfobulbaceae bacterium]MDY0351290.1 hypothetical protein [Desulfobulbaceae bacterium]